MPAARPPVERFWEKVEKTESCWNWTGCLSPAGYGGFFNGEGGHARPVRVIAHRWIYEQLLGPIPEGMELDHLCRNRKCVRPDHCEPVDHAENHRRRRGIKVGWRHLGEQCPNGHARTPENTRINGRGYRERRPCNRIYHQRWMEKRSSKTPTR